MKKSVILCAAMLVTAAAPAFAQNNDAPAILNRASVFYDLNTLYPSGASNSYFNGYGVGYNIDVRVSESCPLYVGTGLDVRFVFNNRNISDDVEYDPVFIKAQSTMINFNLPVNVSYRVPVADRFYITPFAGLNFRVQAYGNTSLKISVPSDTPDEVVDQLERIDTDINLFSSDDMGDNHLRRFQMGWHAGVNFEYNNVNLGLSYGTDFVKLHKNLGGSNFLVSLGYTF
ncbi:MAG: porin family protein [Muribaculaceae bacterium]|nr:porin family protein [Muribaculaceae bacterium]